MTTWRPARWWSGALILLVLGLVPGLHAHEIRPALLEIVERTPGRIDVTWKVPTRGGRALGLTPVLPQLLVLLAPPSGRAVPGAWIEHATYKVDGSSLAGATISIEGLSATLTDVLLRVRLIDGGTHSAILRPGSPSFTIPAPEETRPVKVVLENVARGLRHLVGGPNHSLLIIALVLLASVAQTPRLLVALVLGHAASLVLADLGVLVVPPLLAETLCAVAAVLAANAIALGRRGARPFVALVFLVGVFHGLGFARLVAEGGVTGAGAIQALFALNLGLDVGLALLAALVAGALAATRKSGRFGGARSLAAYAVGISAAAIGISAFMDAVEPARSGQENSPSRIDASQLEAPFGAGGGAGMPAGSTTRPLGQLQDPVAIFLAIEPYEVRLEVLLRVTDLGGLSQLEAIEGQMIEPDAQEPLIQDLLALVAARSPVRIDGKEARPALQRGEFVTIGTYGILTRKQPVPERVSDSLIGVTFVHATDGLPREVSLEWGLFLPGAEEITATTTDPFGGQQTVLTPAAPTLRWENRLAGLKVPVISPVPVLPTRIPVLSIALALAFVFASVISVRVDHRRAVKGLGATCIVLAIVAYPFVRSPVELPASRLLTLTHGDAGDILGGLLSNVYRSFDLRDEDVVYDRLAVSVSGDQLTAIYVQSRRALELEDRGGARSKVDDVNVEEVRGITRQPDGTFSVEAVWTVSGSVSHFGHTHYRQNRYHAVIGLVPDGGTWKVGRLDVLDERRLL